MDIATPTTSNLAPPDHTITVAIEPDTPAEFVTHPWVRARSLARALSDVLAELAAQKDAVRAHIEPAGIEYPVMFEALDWQTPFEKQEYELKRFVRAASAVAPDRGGWSVTRSVETGAVIVLVREPSPDFDAIRKMYVEWRTVRENCTPDKPEAEVDTLYAEYVDLQERITATAPLSASDLAMQIVVETDAGESVWRDDFYERVATIADQAVA